MNVRKSNKISSNEKIKNKKKTTTENVYFPYFMKYLPTLPVVKEAISLLVVPTEFLAITR